MLVKVKDGCKGFYYGERRKSGDIFELREGDAFSSRWMIKLETKKLTNEPKSRGRPKKVKPEANETKNDS